MQTPTKKARPLASASNTPVRRPAPSGPSASPQVKAALAALRQKNKASAAAPKVKEEADPFKTSSAFPGTRGGRESASSFAGSSSSAGDVEGAEWMVKSLESILPNARRTGRLNLSSRALGKLPPEVFNTFIPIDHPYHPSARAPPSSKIKKVDYSFDLSSREEHVSWYEQVDLKYLNAANNEIDEIEEEIAGLEELEVLDFHHNQLTKLPTTLGLLKNLTVVNLSGNQLTSFPVVLFALTFLQELSLADNKLVSLWTTSWKEEVDELMGPISLGASPSASPASPEVDPDAFHSRFPSSPTKQQGGKFLSPSPAASSTTSSASPPPFPKLKKLSLRGNQLNRNLFRQDGFALPAKLVSLDLAHCRLRDDSIPIEFFGALERLEVLDLGYNDIADSLFASASSSEDEEKPKRRYLKTLKTLDLTHNAIDTLASLEAAFSSRSIHRPVTWSGLPKLVQNLVNNSPNPAAGLEGEAVTVKVEENMLRHEFQRRRKAFPPSVRSPHLGTPGKSMPFRAPSEDEDVADGIQGLSISSESPSKASATRRPASPPSRIVSTSAKASFASQSLSSLPDADSFAVPPTDLDLSKNAFVLAPLRGIELLGPTGENLRRLNLSRNRITSLDLPDGALRELTDLNLSTNRLGDMVGSDPILSCIAKFAPALKTLDLSFNLLTNLTSIDAVLAPGLLAPSGAKGLVTLKLDGNKLVDIEGLAKTAEDLKGAGSLGEVGWRVEEISLSDNSINKLPPAMGFLPDNINLPIAGNTFRIPRREIFDCAGGTKKLLSWLRDRA